MENKLLVLSGFFLLFSCSTNSTVSEKSIKNKHSINTEVVLSQKHECLNIHKNYFKQINEITLNKIKVKIETLKSKDTVVNSVFFPVLLPVLDQTITFIKDDKVVKIENLKTQKIDFHKANGKNVSASDSYIYGVYFINKSKIGNLTVFSGEAQTKENELYEFELIYSSNGRLLFDGYNIRDPFKYESFINELKLEKKGLDKNAETKILFKYCYE